MTLAITHRSSRAVTVTATVTVTVTLAVTAIRCFRLKASARITLALTAHKTKK